MTTPVPVEALDAAGKAARPHAADLAQEVAVLIADAAAARKAAATIGAAVARTAHDVLEASAPLIRASEREHVAAALRRATGDNASLHLCRHMLDGHSCGGRTLAELIGDGAPDG